MSNNSTAAISKPVEDARLDQFAREVEESGWDPWIGSSDQAAWTSTTESNEADILGELECKRTMKTITDAGPNLLCV
jgi:hypothetical protein